MFKAKICRMGSKAEIIDLDNIPPTYQVVGYTEDMTPYRSKGGLCQRKELDNQPIIEGFLGPMWDGDMLRYETQELYNALSN